MMGMSGTVWELAARIPGGIGTLVLVKQNPSLGLGWIYDWPSSLTLPTPVSAFPLNPGIGNFPWGHVVEPD